MRKFEVIRKILEGYFVCKDRSGYYVFGKDVKAFLASGEELYIEDEYGNPVGWMFLTENGIGFEPFSLPKPYIES